MMLAEKTRELRYRLIYILSPSAYRTISVSDVPRPMIKFVKKVHGDTSLVGAEIGTGNGNNARSILEILNIKRLYLIDPYEPYVEDGLLRSPLYQKKKAIMQLEPFKDKLQWITLKSSDAVSKIPNNLDFVYIDGDHEYDSVKSDIENYYPKVKISGVIGGHDFTGNYLGVIHSVLDFVDDNNLKLYTKSSDWWLIKA